MATDTAFAEGVLALVGRRSTGLYMTAFGQLTSPGPVRLSCQAATAGPSLQFVRLTAIKVGSISLVPLD